jgi:hypothetical protein
MTSAPTFTLFLALPVELQSKIWHRIIQVHRRDGSDGCFYFNGARPPVALHTCQTSRAVACSVFKADSRQDSADIVCALVAAECP